MMSKHTWFELVLFLVDQDRWRLQAAEAPVAEQQTVLEPMLEVVSVNEQDIIITMEYFGFIYVNLLEMKIMNSLDERHLIVSE